MADDDGTGDAVGGTSAATTLTDRDHEKDDETAFNAELTCLDRVLFRLSDGCREAPSPPPSPPSGKKRRRPSSSSSFGSNNDGREDGDDDERDAPPGLTSQYREVHALLRRGLLGTDDGGCDADGGGDGGGDNRGRGGTSGGGRRRHNVSALLMGPRGHGRGLVLERCLSSLRRLPIGSGGWGGGDGEKRGRRFFRIVRLNGLLLRGDDAASVVREAVRQLSEIATVEKMKNETAATTTAKGGAGGSAVAPTASSSTVDGANGGGGSGVVDDDGPDSAGLGMGVNGGIMRKRGRRRSGIGGVAEKNDPTFKHRPFTSNLALLDEVLRTSRIDDVPVLIVLDELDSFLGGQSSSSVSSSLGSSSGGGTATSGAGGAGSTSSTDDRQLLLYHLLDRVADHRFLVSLVGVTSKLSTVGLFEKRVKSRAEGTSKVIYFGHPATYGLLVEMLLSKFGVESEEEEGGDETNRMKRAAYQMRDDLLNVLRPGNDSKTSSLVNASEAEALARDGTDGNGGLADRIRDAFVRNYRMGKDVRWFCRVLTVALSLVAEDYDTALCRRRRQRLVADGGSADLNKRPSLRLTPRHLFDGLTAMGGTSPEDCGDPALRRFGGSGGRNDDDDPSVAYGGDLRLRALLDLDGAQCAVLLAARRILSRDARRDDEGIGQEGAASASAPAPASTQPLPLTYDRIREEYLGSFVGRGRASGPDRYSRTTLFRSFVHLMETDVVRPSADHTGGGPLQYDYGRSFAPAGMDEMSFGRVPLNINVDLDQELLELLRANLLDCSTALRDWGLKLD